MRQKPRYVDEAACIGCRKCEYACPVEVEDEFEGRLGARRAAYIPFTNAIPQTALIDAENCILCGRCVTACPTDAIVLDQKPSEFELQAKVVVATTGWRLTPLDAKSEYGQGRIANVLAPTQMERMLAPHGPYGRVLRPSDGKVPDSVAYVQCAGSRDQSLGVPYCSRVCCMYAIKQAILLSGTLPFASITIYYMDIRAFGKGYEEFYRSAQAMGIEFIKGKVAPPGRERGPERDRPGRAYRPVRAGRGETIDLVVLSLGLAPAVDLGPPARHGDGLGWLRRRPPPQGRPLPKRPRRRVRRRDRHRPEGHRGHDSRGRGRGHGSGTIPAQRRGTGRRLR